MDSPSDTGVITLIISIAAVIFSLGTLVSDIIRNRNILIHDLQVDGQVFHRTLIQLERLHCYSIEEKKASLPGMCNETSFFSPASNSRGQEILLQRAESLENRIEILLKKLNMGEFGYITPVDYRTLAKEEIRDLNFEKAKLYIGKEVREIGAYRGHPGYVLRSIHADLMEGWYKSILEGKKQDHLSGALYFDRALARAQSQIAILPVRNYTIVFILQEKGCARWVGRSLFYSASRKKGEDEAFRISREILKNEPRSIRLLHPLRQNAAVFEAGQRGEILSICQEMFEQI
ncbi:MAG: hypothetical protein ACP5OP_03275 [Leptospirillia bacterium]